MAHTPNIDHLLWQHMRDALPNATDEQVTEVLEHAKARGRELRDRHAPVDPVQAADEYWPEFKAREDMDRDQAP